MTLEGITIDFWDTLVISRVGGEGRRRLRRDQVIGVGHAHGITVRVPTLDEAFKGANRRFDQAWLGQRVTPPTSQYVQWVWDALEIVPTTPEHEQTVQCFQDSLLAYPPALAPDAPQVLRALAERAQLAIISDTMISPGTVLRSFLDQHGILDCFTAFVFSDETGCAKPDPRAYETAARRLGTEPSRTAHIGDLRRTDVAGARAVGARSILYTGVREDLEGPDPDAVAESWSALPSILFAEYG